MQFLEVFKRLKSHALLSSSTLKVKWVSPVPGCSLPSYIHIDGHVDAISKTKGDPFRRKKKLLCFCIQAIVFTKSIALFEEEATHLLCLSQVIYSYEDGLSLGTLAAESGGG